MMPDGAAEDRSNQLAILNGIAHSLLTAPEISDLLDEAEQSRDTLSPWQRANLREMRRTYLHEWAPVGGLGLITWDRTLDGGQGTRRKIVSRLL